LPIIQVAIEFYFAHFTPLFKSVFTKEIEML